MTQADLIREMAQAIDEIKKKLHEIDQEIKKLKALSGGIDNAA